MIETGTASDYKDLLEKLDAFLTTNGSAFGLAYAGTGNGLLTGLKGGTASVAETFTITATSSTNFTVVGSVSGSLSAATVGTPYTGTKVQFLISAGGTAFIAGDAFTLSTAPKWQNMRKARGCTITASVANTGQSAGENVIDGKSAADSNRNWNPSGAVGATLEHTFETAETIVEYSLMGSNGFMPTAWTLEYWNGSSWVTLDTRSGITWTTSVFQTYAIASPVSATRYRISPTWPTPGVTGAIDAIRMKRTAGSFDAAFSQYIWRCFGNDANSEIYCGLHHFRRGDIDYHDWELAAFDGFSSGADFYAQPNVHRRVYTPLWNSTITYWFIANGRRVIVVAKLGSQYELAYLGLLDAYFSPGQMPYPHCLGGSLQVGTTAPNWNSTSWRYSNGTNQHRMPTHADNNTTLQASSVFESQLRARLLDGTWEGFFAGHADNLQTVFTGENWIWPYVGDVENLDPNLDGSVALWPVALLQRAPNLHGQLDGIFAISGQSITPETLIRRGALDHLALPNITRTDRDDWLAVALD